MMFIKVNKKYYNGNSMGIRGNLDELYQTATEITKEIFKENPRATIEVKITMYI
jgi:hypothetical protein